MMRLSESLRRNIMKTTIGGILNKFKGKSRRNTLFFEEILANYIKECEKAGYGKNIKEIGQKWIAIISPNFIPSSLKKLSPILLTRMIKEAWINIGIVDDLHITKKDNTIKATTKNECITRIIGKNKFMIGCSEGLLNSLHGFRISCVEAIQTKKYCEYKFEIKDDIIKYQSKKKSLYDNLNYLPSIEGFTLKDALKKNILKLKDNKICFRDKPLIFIENTLFHLLANRDLLLEKISELSYNHFNKIIKAESSNNKKLSLIKFLLQVMGWGIITIISKENKIIIKIKNPPYGFQLEEDNWGFLVRTILGYLHLLDKNFEILNVNEFHKNLEIIYSV